MRAELRHVKARLDAGAGLARRIRHLAARGAMKGLGPAMKVMSLDPVHFARSEIREAFFMRRDSRRVDRDSRRGRFDRGQAETFVERREEKCAGSRQENPS